MKNRQNLSTMSVEQLMEVNGGGFAYDLARAIRSFGMYIYGGMPAVIADSVYMDAINEQANS
ncbi:MAG: hypothetical protein K8R52_07275 [Bacteroidales bacterium]|nr:hypothetical protein [Bacteroidales bacterium]